MQAPRKAKGEHKQKRHNNSCVLKSSVVENVPWGNGGNTNPDHEGPLQEPWAKWI